jgi:hypothetical protein
MRAGLDESLNRDTFVPARKLPPGTFRAEALAGTMKCSEEGRDYLPLKLDSADARDDQSNVRLGGEGYGS